MFKKNIFVENESSNGAVFAVGRNGSLYRYNYRNEKQFKPFSKDIKKIESRFSGNVLFLSKNGKSVSTLIKSFYYYGAPTIRKTRIIYEKGIYGKKIKDIFALESSTFVLLENGDLFGFGKNEKNQLGIKTNGYKIEKPKKIDTSFLSSNETIKDIQGYKFFSILLTNRGTAFSTGLGIDGQIGHQGYGRVRFSYIKHLPMFKIKQIAVGKDHSLFLTKDETVYGCGKNEYGALSSLGKESPNKNVLVPKELGIKNVIKIEAGDSCSVFTVLKGGKIRFFICGKLRQSPSKMACFVPHEVKFDINSLPLDFVDLHFGQVHSFFVNRNGEMYESFSSGLFNYGNKDLKPKKMNFKVKMIPVKNTRTNFSYLLLEKQIKYHYTNLKVLCLYE